VTRLLPALTLILAAVAIAGCGSSSSDDVATAAAPAPAAKAEHVRTLPKKVFVRRVNAICKGLEKVDIGGFPAITADVSSNRLAIGAWFGRAHKAVRSARRRLVHLGRPRRDRARWVRVMSKMKAIEGHMDTLRAASWSGSVAMLRLSARELLASAKSVDRRFRRFGARRCAD
jgi:hypothetical protein